MTNFTDKEKIVELLDQCGLSARYPLISQNLFHFANYIYWTIGPSSVYENCGTSLINNIQYIKEWAHHICCYHSSCGHNICLSYEIEQFVSYKYIADFTGKKTTDVLAIFHHYNLFNRIGKGFAPDSYSDADLAKLQKILIIFLMLELAKIFYLFEVSIKFNVPIPNIMVYTMRNILQKGLRANIKVEDFQNFLMQHENEIPDTENEDKSQKFGCIIAIYEKQKELWQFIAKRNMIELRSQNPDLHVLTDKYFIRKSDKVRKRTSSSIISSLNISDIYLAHLISYVNDDVSEQSFPILRMPDDRVSNKKLVIEI